MESDQSLWNTCGRWMRSRKSLRQNKNVHQTHVRFAPWDILLQISVGRIRLHGQ